MASRYYPEILKLSQKKGIDLNDVTGTGLGGRITRKDIIAFDKSNEKEFESSKESEQDQVKREVEQPEIKTDETDVEIPLSPVRRAIAQNMVQSKQEIPHAWMTVEADVTDIVTYRNDVKDSFKEKEGINVTYFSFFIKVIVNSLKNFIESIIK